MHLEHKTNVEELITACLNGNSKAQQALYRMFSSRMFALCLRYAPDRDSASEIMQQGFITMFRKLREYRHDGPFEGWLRRIMISRGLEEFRRRSKHLMEPVDETNFEELPCNELTDVDAEELLQFVMELPPSCRMVFNLYAIEGYTHKEVGEMMQISEGTSKSQLARARSLLQGRLAAKGISYGRKTK